MAQPVEATLTLAAIEEMGKDYNGLARLQFQVHFLVAQWYPFVNAIGYRRLMEIYADSGRVAWVCNVRVIGTEEEVLAIQQWAGRMLHTDNVPGTSVGHFREL